MEMPSVLKMRQRRDHADQDGRAACAASLLTVARASLRFDIVRVRGGELLEARDQPARDEHQDESDHQDGGDARRPPGSNPPR